MENAHCSAHREAESFLTGSWQCQSICRHAINHIQKEQISPSWERGSLTVQQFLSGSNQRPRDALLSVAGPYLNSEVPPYPGPTPPWWHGKYRCNQFACAPWASYSPSPGAHSPAPHDPTHPPDTIFSLPYIKSAVLYLHSSTDEKTEERAETNSAEMHLTYGAAFSSSPHTPTTKVGNPLV